MTDSIVQGEPCGAEGFMDRYWFLVKGRRWRISDAADKGAARGATLVLRDGECVVVSLEAAALGWPEGTLLFRLKSDTTPCVGCVDRAVALARHGRGESLSPNDVRHMLRFAVARCAAAGVDAVHGHDPGAHHPPESAEDIARVERLRRGGAAQGDKRYDYDAELWLIL